MLHMIKGAVVPNGCTDCVSKKTPKPPILRRLTFFEKTKRRFLVRAVHGKAIDSDSQQSILTVD